MSVVAAAVLLTIKLVAGLAVHSLGLVSEALHSGTDLVAALLTFFAVGVAVRPADVTHQYGHGKAEHLSALAEATILVGASILIAWRAINHLVGATPTRVEATWYALVVIAVVIVVDLSRTLVSLRGARRYQSAALQASALHFGTDLLGSAAVLVGLVLVRAGYARADSAAALFVAALVLLAAARLMKRNVDVLMDRAPAEAEEAALAAIAGIEPAVEVRRLRMRQAGPRQFADVVITVPPGAAVGQGHEAADRVEAAVHDALPGSDVVVHVEPLKLPGDLTLEDAHEVASAVERAIIERVPEVDAVQTHLEPLSEAGEGRRAYGVDTDAVARIVREATGSAPRELRFLNTNDGLLVYLTLALDPDTPLADAHARASDIEERIRAARPDIADVIVHTEP